MKESFVTNNMLNAVKRAGTACTRAREIAAALRELGRGSDEVEAQLIDLQGQCDAAGPILTALRDGTYKIPADENMT